jgi:hypothetical protein
MGRRHDESEARERAARSNDDPVEEAVDDPRTEPDDDVISNPAPPASKEYVDLEIARIQPMA